jgi:hypothetical protein
VAGLVRLLRRIAPVGRAALAPAADGPVVDALLGAAMGVVAVGSAAARREGVLAVAGAPAALPLRDRSVEAVLVLVDEAAALDEARRVASAHVIALRRAGADPPGLRRIADAPAGGLLEHPRRAWVLYGRR